MLFWIGSKKTWVKLFSPQLCYFFPPVTLFFSFSPQLSYFFPPVTLFFSFSPQLRYLICFRGKNSVTGGKNTKIAQDIYYIKQTPSYAIFPATLFWNSTGHLLHKTNPDLSYSELSYVFWEPNYSVGYDLSAVIGWNYSIQTREQIL